MCDDGVQTPPYNFNFCAKLYIIQSSKSLDELAVPPLAFKLCAPAKVTCHRRDDHLRPVRFNATFSHQNIITIKNSEAHLEVFHKLFPVLPPGIERINCAGQFPLLNSSRQPERSMRNVLSWKVPVSEGVTGEGPKAL